jgi:two-component system chemotaxis sensor kinase CheA
VHSIKGGSAYFSLIEMSKCSHLLENMLHEVRDGKRTLDEKLKALLLTYIDVQKEVMKRAKECASANVAMTTSAQAQEFLGDLHSYAHGEVKLAPVSVAPSLEAVAPSRATPTQEHSPAPERAASAAASEASADKGDKLQVKNFVKVDTARLDQLIDSIGEMVIYSSMLVRQCREHLEGDQVVMNTTHRVEKFGRDLQDIGMSMRLVPIKGLFQKMSRLVWDASKKLGKELDFQVDGEDTELDRNLIDKLADPLMHMVRNAIDHGIESPEVREAAGKPRAGRVKLAAYHAGGSIHIEISDDGKGLDPEKLIAKAIEKGVITRSQRLTNEEAYQLIFAAGFSTAAVVTDISGRGVGMDVVRRNVESLRGRIRIRSEVGRGSTFTIELPLTLAIIDGIQVRVGKENFIIPSLSIVEFVRPTRDTINTTLDRGETFAFREKYLPVFRLSHLYGIESPLKDLSEGALVVVENGTEFVALAVDAILGEYSTVIKNLGPMFADQKGTAGCAIMPDGDISLILDVRTLIELAREVYRAPSGNRGTQLNARDTASDSHA